jgi:hypothetical protein
LFLVTISTALPLSWISLLVLAPDEDDAEQEDADEDVDMVDAKMAAARAELLPTMLTMWWGLPLVVVREYGLEALRKSLNTCLEQ